MRIKNFKIFTLLILTLFCRNVYSQQFSESHIRELQQNIDTVLQSVISNGITVSVKIMHADYNKILYELNPEIKVIPASITKIVTTACAFSKLGQSYNFKTVIYTDDNNINDGVVNGNIYLKGFGDPDLNSSDIEHLAGILVNKNIKEITGNVVADESYFDTDYYTLANYYKGDTGPSYWPYINALPLNKNEGYSNPALSAAELLSTILTSSGVTVSGTSIVGVTPKASKEIAQISHTIYDVIANTNKESNNHSAITIFKLLGAKIKSNPGTIEKGQEAIEQFLTDIGIDRYSYDILEGSGLTRYNKVTAEMYMKVLKYMYDDRFLFDYFLNSLSIAGKDGTLRNRMTGTSAEGNVYGKTGTLNGVSSLTGYVIDKDSEVIMFYIVMNGFGGNSKKMRDIQDEICILLAEFFRK